MVPPWESRGGRNNQKVVKYQKLWYFLPLFQLSKTCQITSEYDAAGVTRGLSLAVASLFQGLAPLELSSRSTVATASNSNQWPPQLSKTWSRWVRLGMLSAATATRMRPSPTTTCLFCFKTIQRLRCDAHALHSSCSLVQRENSCARSPCTSMRLGSERGGDV